jgi:hypothetical protein
MPYPQTYELSDHDLGPVIASQRVLRESLDGQEIPLDVLVPIALRCVDAHELAGAVLHTLRSSAGVK